MAGLSWISLATVTLVAGLAVVPCAAEGTIQRVSGTVSEDNVAGLEIFLSNAIDGVIGLKLLVEAEDGNRDGEVQAYVDGDLLIIYRAGPDTETEIAASGGYQPGKGGFVFDGFYLVKYGGLDQGIMSLALSSVDAAQVVLSGAVIEELGIDHLDPSH